MRCWSNSVQRARFLRTGWPPRSVCSRAGGLHGSELGASLVGVGINGGSGRELRDPDIRDTQYWAMSLFAAGKHMLDR